LSRALAAQGHRVVALTPRVKERTEWNGASILPYKIEASTGKDTHRCLTDLDTKIKRADYFWRAARKLRDAGFAPEGAR